MERLLLQNTKVSDVTPLKQMQKLRDLDLSNTRVTDVSPLKGLLGDISPLKRLWDLSWLWIHGSKVTDICAFKHHKHLNIYTKKYGNRYQGKLFDTCK